MSRFKTYGQSEGGLGTRALLQASTYRPGWCWLFVRNSPNGSVKGVMHLDLDSAVDLRDALNAYIEDAEALDTYPVV